MTPERELRERVAKLKADAEQELERHSGKDGVVRDLTCSHCGNLLGQIGAYETVLKLLR